MDMQKVMMPLTTLLKAGVLFALLGSAAYADWYRVKVFQVVPRADTGDVFVQILPGATETAFTEKSRGVIFNTEPGANKVMAVLLTSIALDAEITVEMAAVPTWATPQVITATGLVAP